MSRCPLICALCPPRDQKVCQRPFCSGVEEAYDAPFELEFGAPSYAECDAMVREVHSYGQLYENCTAGKGLDEKVLHMMLDTTIENRCIGGRDEDLQNLRGSHEMERIALDYILRTFDIERSLDRAVAYRNDMEADAEERKYVSEAYKGGGKSALNKKIGENMKTLRDIPRYGGVKHGSL